MDEKRHLAEVRVAGSNPVFRSNRQIPSSTGLRISAESRPDVGPPEIDGSSDPGGVLLLADDDRPQPSSAPLAPATTLRRDVVQMRPAVTRRREVHCSLFTIGSNAAIGFVPRFSKRLRARANPSRRFRQSWCVHSKRYAITRISMSGDRVSVFWPALFGKPHADVTSTEKASHLPFSPHLRPVNTQRDGWRRAQQSAH
jgi:hypothetical protein